MRCPILLLLAASAAGFQLPPAGVVRARSVRRSSLPVALLDDDDELDAADTSDPWDAQIAEEAAWRASQAGASDPHVDEEAHLGLGDDDDEPDDTAMSLLREIERRRNPLEPPAAGGGGDGETAKQLSRLLNSASSILSAVARLDEKVERLERKLEKLALQGPAPLDAPAEAGGWDGTGDEFAHQDYDIDDPLLD